jgi:peptidoglycan/xylan/chitin deacetylase (PgdA/CDA1 family)
VATREPVAALTFDDGPHPLYTPRLLTLLKKHRSVATFFVVGDAANRHPGIIKKIASAGHAIGNHSWDHPIFPRIRSRQRRWVQLRTCANATIPYSDRLFRPPFGAHNLSLQLDAFFLGYKVVLWNLSLTDWLPQQPEAMSARMIERIQPGTIILLHDAIYCSTVSETQWDRGPMLDGLDMALAVLKRRFRFVTVPELLQLGRAVRTSC